MKKKKQEPAGSCTDSELATKIAEETFLVSTQREIQKLLNIKGLRYRDLAKRLDVSEARISQLFGDSATNLTIRTIAKIFHVLGETPYVITEAELDRLLTPGKFDHSSLAGVWSLGESAEQVQSAANVDDLEPLSPVSIPISANQSSHRWMMADRSAKARRVVGGRR